MRALKRLAAAFGFGVAALGFSVASADDHRDKGRYGDDYDRGRPGRCDVDHDHRSHDARYYDYYPGDRYSRGDYDDGRGRDRDGDRWRDRDDDRRWRDRDRDDYRYGYDRRSRVVKRRSFDTRYRAQILLVEELFYAGYGQRLVCTVSARGPDARYISHGQLRRIAARNCSRRAEIRIH